ncbi:MAG: helix-turn-helix domain-containing protein [Pseudonocardiaceae bacterium]
MPVRDGMAEPVPNRLLRVARQARRLTQQQLAEAVCAAYYTLFDKEAAIDADYVSKLERGEITWPNARYREAFRTVLGADTDAELGFYSRRSQDTVEDGELADSAREVDTARRNEFIRLLGGLGAGARLGVVGAAAALPDPLREVLSRAATPLSPPGRVGRTDVEQVRISIEMFRSWRGRYGGGACRHALAGQLRWAVGLLDGEVDDAVKEDLYAAVGSLAQGAGWADVDAGYHDTALPCFHLALYCAGEASDWTLRAQILTCMSSQAIILGRLDDAMSWIELAQVRADRVAGTGRAYMNAVHADVLGSVGQVSDCRRAIAAAEDHFAGHRPADSLGSSTFQEASLADIAFVNGTALFGVGLRDRAVAPAAISQLRSALTDAGPLSQVRQAEGTARLATLELLHGDRDAALALGHQALDFGGHVRSAQVTEDLRHLHIATTRHQGEAVEELQQRLSPLLRSA